ncbi:HpcH/HpaI aldolase/citrate lyase family protein [Roseomonas gilardii]|uniref:HpcH/HpaI aldolase/citrate lyase family protein n=1 Tax=Roseomonas gilardii TaxID=257708 RepID=UPI0004ACB08E|nr:CoA ester lyase [Roseomonas gilardii]
MKLRALLFAPGDSERKAGKALGSTADAVILDLEDSVAAAEKTTAREATAGLLAGSHARSGRVVRVNARDSGWYLADLAAVVPARPDAVMLPKCTSAEDLRALDHHLEAMETAAGLPIGGIGILPIVTETAASLRDMRYAGITPRLRALVFGAEDLAADLGIAPRDADGRQTAAIQAARASLLLAAAEAQVPAIDTPWPDPRDPDGLEREATEAARDGFAGKLCIHPAQIDPVTAAFTPSPERIAWAQAVQRLFAEASGAGVLTLDGKMIDRPHLRLAERILATVAV